MIRLRSCPARPTNGSPWASSSAPGASPMNITLAFGFPTPKTVCVRVCASSWHRTHWATRAARAARRSWRLSEELGRGGDMGSGSVKRTASEGGDAGATAATLSTGMFSRGEETISGRCSSGAAATGGAERTGAGAMDAGGAGISGKTGESASGGGTGGNGRARGRAPERASVPRTSSCRATGGVQSVRSAWSDWSTAPEEAGLRFRVGIPKVQACRPGDAPS